MKHIPEDIEAHGADFDTNHDRALLLGVIVAIIIGIVLILWAPDVEAMGTWVHNIIF